MKNNNNWTNNLQKRLGQHEIHDGLGWFMLFNAGQAGGSV